MKPFSLGFLPRSLSALGCALSVALLAPAPANSQTQETPGVSPQTGVISGSVSSAATHNMLQGVSVSIPALNKRAVTDANGQFLLDNLPVGNVELVSTYTGSAEDRRSVIVAANAVQTVAIQLAPEDLVMLDRFVVAGQEEGEALATTMQKEAPNIINVQALDSDISSSDMPNFDVAVQAMSLPGVTANFSQGTVNELFINGFPNTLTRATFDGYSGLSAIDGRRPTYTFFSSSLFQDMQLTTAVTPDVSADSIGGTINLVSPSPLSMSDKERFNYDAGLYWVPGFSEYRSDYQANHDLSGYYAFGYQGVYDVLGGHRNLGILIRTFWGSFGGNYGYVFYNYEPGAPSPAYIWDARSFDLIATRDVTGLNAKVEYRPSSNHKFFFQFMFNMNDAPMIWNQTTRAFAAETISNGTTGAIQPGFTQNSTTALPVSGTNYTLTDYAQSSRNQNYIYTVGGTDTYGPLTLDWTGRYNTDRYPTGNGEGNNDGGQLTMTDPTIGWHLTRNSNLDYPALTQTAGASIYNINSYTSSVSFTDNDQNFDNDILEGYLNATYKANDILTFKTGVGMLNHEFKTIYYNQEQWNPAAGVSPSQYLPQVYLPADRYDNGLPMVDAQFMWPYITNPALWTDNEYYRIMQNFQGYSITENVESEYLQATAKLGRLTVLGGLRVEETEDVGYAYTEAPAATAAQIPDPIARAYHDWDHPTTDRGYYTYRFPSIFLNYKVTDRLVALASYSTSFGRPPFTDLTPVATINNTAQTVTTGNPSLLPEYSENWDFALDYYLNAGGSFQAHYLRKSVTDYIETATSGIVGSGPNNGYSGNYAGYTLNQDTNIGSAKVSGWEFAYDQKMLFLPGELKGLELAGSFTMLSAEGNFGGATIINGGEIANFIPKSASASLAYHLGKFGFRVIFNYQCPYPTSVSLTNSAATIYNDYRKTLSPNINYSFTPKLAVYAQVFNILQETQDAYIGNPNQLYERFFIPAAIQIGVKGQF